jgi:hypothetical protein
MEQAKATKDQLTFTLGVLDDLREIGYITVLSDAPREEMADVEQWLTVKGLARFDQLVANRFRLTKEEACAALEAVERIYSSFNLDIATKTNFSIMISGWYDLKAALVSSNN